MGERLPTVCALPLPRAVPASLLPVRAPRPGRFPRRPPLPAHTHTLSLL